MTCANWTLTISAIAIFVFTYWPDYLGAETSKWIVIVFAAIVLLTAWLGVKCKWCSKEEVKTEKPIVTEIEGKAPQFTAPPERVPKEKKKKQG